LRWKASLPRSWWKFCLVSAQWHANCMDPREIDGFDKTHL